MEIERWIYRGMIVVLAAVVVWFGLRNTGGQNVE